MSSEGVAWDKARAAAEERAGLVDKHAALCREVEDHSRAAEVLRVLSCHVPARAEELRGEMDAVASLRDDALRRRDDAAARLERQVVVADLYTELPSTTTPTPPPRRRLASARAPRTFLETRQRRTSRRASARAQRRCR